MVFRVYVEKKPGFDVEAQQLTNELRTILGIRTLKGVRLVNRYDVEGIDEQLFEQVVPTVFSEPQSDNVSFDQPDFGENAVFAVEYLPGQFDQRADSASECIQLISQGERPTVRTATVYALDGALNTPDVDAVKHYVINPVEAREAGLEMKDTLTAQVPLPGKVEVIDGFRSMEAEQMERFIADRGLAMDVADLEFCRRYFEEEGRDPTITEIRVIDTYWSDHCRHTTFGTQLDSVTIDDAVVQAAFERYLAMRDELGRSDRPVTLMDMGTLGAKWLKANGVMTGLDESEEINACTVKVKVDVNGEDEDWLFLFKNETHNHPTEIEPFGGAATCIGGCIRDPLSGRAYVYQAMRVTGAADPHTPVDETLEGKLPQRKLVTTAAHGYSSYGNQIGLATGQVNEIYHPGYVAKRMEVGAVVAATPADHVRRETPAPGDKIILLGGRTGRDGIGGATGSSKAHNVESLELDGAEVQKGNAPVERKLQRLFRRGDATRLIKRCNDFGAGGVSVAVGEIADGLDVDLNKVPKKYEGLDGTELAISESQERMAVDVAAEDVDEFLRYAQEENLEAVVIATVTEDPRMVMRWDGDEIVNLSREFLSSNGADKHQDAHVAQQGTYVTPFNEGTLAERLDAMLNDLNVASNKGLAERFDSTIGAGTVLMPFGGREQLTAPMAMVAKLPVLKGRTDTVTMMSYGFDPCLSSWSPYHGAIYAVLTSIAKIAAAGGDYKKIRFTFQEYFRRMSEEPTRWSQPFAALLGAYDAQLGFGLPSIGGKDSMSGSFKEEDGEEVNVPPTLVSFAVDVADQKTMISPEFKKAGSKIVVFNIEKDAYDLPVYGQIMDGYGKLFEDIKAGRVISAYAVERNGMAEAVSKMAFGNHMGVKIEHNVDPRDFFAPGWGSIVCEVPDGRVGELSMTYTVIGEVTEKAVFEYGNVSVSLDEALDAWNAPLEDVFPTESGVPRTEVKENIFKADSITICTHKIGTPNVFIPVFPGTNCEYDSARVFEQAGARVSAKVFRNLSAEDIRDSVEAYRKEIAKAQILMFPGGFSAGDEPEGSAKFFATAFRNEVIREEVEKLLNERDGLILGICNGFQALIKLGLVPEGKITEQKPDSPTLTYNTIGRHVSKMVNLKVVSNKSPWLSGAELGGIYVNPVSHGEGRFVANEEWLKTLFANGQVATQYVDADGNPTMDEYWNPNGSYMAIEGITSPDGRVYGKMAHSERQGDGVAKNIYGEQDMKIFESGVRYFK